MRTCDMVNGVESNPKFPHFEGILCLDAALQVLYALPVFIFELCIVVGQQCGSLEGSQIGMHEQRLSMLPAVDEKLHRLGPSIIRILNNFLRKSFVRSGARSKSDSVTSYLANNIARHSYLENLAVRVSLENRFYRHRQWRPPLSKLFSSQKLAHFG